MLHRLFLAGLLSLGACASGEVSQSAAPNGAEPFLPDPRPMGSTLVYECLGYEFIARIGPGEMAVWLEDRYLILSQARSASGVKYAEGDVIFWTKGDEATLFLGAQRHTECQLAPGRAPWEDARRRGIDFRAVGNEPGWHLEIRDGGQMLYIGDYGMNRVMTPDPGAEEVASGRIYHAVTEANELIVEIVDEACTDTMKGDSFPAQVNVTINGKTLRGCGMALDYPWQ